MIGILLCLAAFASTLLASRRSLYLGLLVLFSWGYAYGITRANIQASGSYFVFDASVVAFYWGQWKNILSNSEPRLRTLRIWVTALIAWPCVLAFFPFQHPLVSLVGLRGNLFFLPMILVGAMLADGTLRKFAIGIATLNVLVLAIAGGEYFWGVPTFYPLNASTELIYASNDVAGYQFLRIPATFVTAHVYAGTMLTTLPFLFGAWTQTDFGKWKKALLMAGMFAALLGVLLSSTRLNVAIAVLLALSMMLAGNFSSRDRLIIVGLLVALGLTAFSNERFARFKSLGDTSAVTERVHGSVNRGFWEILYEYPMGNGLGGGGTSMPYFLADLVRHPVMMENEYSRILLETGIAGLALWSAFILWFITGFAAFAKSAWRAGRILAWVCCLANFAVGMIGIGMMSAIPQTVSLFLLLGWVAVRPAPESAPPSPRLNERLVFAGRVPALSR